MEGSLFYLYEGLRAAGGGGPGKGVQLVRLRERMTRPLPPRPSSPPPTSRAAPSVVPAGSAATPITAEVTTAAHSHTQARAPCCAKVTGEACWAPVVLALQSSCVGQCTHAMWHSLGSMMHNALRGTRIEEASHPGPVYPPHAVCSHDPHRAVRIGEASNPGPKNNGGALSSLLQGLDLKAMLLPLITEMIQQAIAEIVGGTVQQMGPRPHIDAAQTPGKPKGRQGR